MSKETINNALAVQIQREFPLDSRPFHVLGDKLNMTADEVMRQILQWKDEGYIREISAVMEGSALDYDSALVCGRIPEERLEEVAAVISAHPTVTHNYKRTHDYNLWFTIAVPRSMGLENHLLALEKLSGSGKLYPLRRVETFKVGVVFDFNTRTNDTQYTELPENIVPLDPSPKEQEIIRTLQKNLPITERPFQALAEKNGLKEADLLDFAKKHKGGVMRKYIGTFKHRKMGISSNGMTVWNILPENMTKTGLLLAQNSEVSHCYSRENFSEFPYNLYTMLHAKDRESLDAIAQKLSKIIQCEDYLVLESTIEFKKTRLRYFLTELDEWWRKIAA